MLLFSAGADAAFGLLFAGFPATPKPAALLSHLIISFVPPSTIIIVYLPIHPFRIPLSHHRPLKYHA